MFVLLVDVFLLAFEKEHFGVGIVGRIFRKLQDVDLVGYISYTQQIALFFDLFSTANIPSRQLII